MEVILKQTKKGNYYRNSDGYYCVYCDGRETKCLSFQGIKILINTLYKLNDKRKIN
jgi:hypothetical protein